MFYLVGLGLCDEKDITVRGLEVPGFCSRSTYFLNSRTLDSQTLNESVPRGLHEHPNGAKRAASMYAENTCIYRLTSLARKRSMGKN